MHIVSPAGGLIYLFFANLAKFRHYFEHCNLSAAAVAMGAH
jgi:hypothetical protein